MLVLDSVIALRAVVDNLVKNVEIVNLIDVERVIAKALQLTRGQQLFGKHFFGSTIEGPFKLLRIKVLAKHYLLVIETCGVYKTIRQYPQKGFQKVKKCLADLGHKILDIVVVLMHHAFKSVVTFLNASILQCVEHSHSAAFIFHLFEVLIVGVAAINIQDGQILHSFFLKLHEVVKVHPERRTAEYHGSRRFSKASEALPSRLYVGVLPSKREEQLLQGFGHVELKGVLRRDQYH